MASRGKNNFCTRPIMPGYGFIPKWIRHYGWTNSAELEFGIVPNQTRQLVSTYSLAKKILSNARGHVPTCPLAGDATVNCNAIHKDAHLLVINDAAEQSAVVGMLASTRSLYQFLYLLCFLQNQSWQSRSSSVEAFLSIQNVCKI